MRTTPTCQESASGQTRTFGHAAQPEKGTIQEMGAVLRLRSLPALWHRYQMQTHKRKCPSADLNRNPPEMSPSSLRKEEKPRPRCPTRTMRRSLTSHAVLVDLIGSNADEGRGVMMRRRLEKAPTGQALTWAEPSSYCDLTMRQW